MSENDNHPPRPQEPPTADVERGADTPVPVDSPSDERPTESIGGTRAEPAAGDTHAVPAADTPAGDTHPGPAAGDTPAGDTQAAPAAGAAGAPAGGWNQSGGWQAASGAYQPGRYPAGGYQQGGYQQGGYQPGGYQPTAQHGSAQHGGYQGSGQYGAGQPGYPAPTATYQNPWAAGAGAPPHPPSRPSSAGRFGRWAAAGVLALLLACGGGLAGGLIVHEVDQEDTTTSATSTGTSTGAAPTIDRSSLAGIVAAVQPSVVDIKTQSGEGSGVVLTSDGYVLTNNHVVAGATGSVSVSFSNGRTASAKVVGTDPKSDLAVVKANGVSGLTAAKFGDSSGMRVGDSVFAIGSPLGLEGSVTSGIISATNRTIVESGEETGGARNSIAGALQTDAAINPGNSGGALVNLSGEVVGINTAIATSGQGQGNIGVGFAIPSNRAKQVADQLIKGGKVSHPYLGLGVSDAPNNGGALVSQVVRGAPAEKAGIKQGDVITKAGDKAIHNGDDLVSAVQSSKVGDKLTLTVSRNGSEQTITVTVGES